MLLGAVSAGYAPQLVAFETYGRRVALFADTVDQDFASRNAAVLYYTNFADSEETRRKRMSNMATPKPGRIEKDWTKLKVTMPSVRGNLHLKQRAVIALDVRKIFDFIARLLTRAFLAPFMFENVIVIREGCETKAANDLIVSSHSLDEVTTKESMNPNPTGKEEDNKTWVDMWSSLD